MREPVKGPDGGERSVGAGSDDERHLRHEAQLHRAVLLASPVALLSLDLAGRVTSWNPAAERLFGWSADEVLGRPNPIVQEERLEEFAALRRRVASGESLAGLEVVRRRRDGTRLPLSLSTAPVRDEAGRVVGIMAALEDLSEKRRAAAELEAKSRRLATLVADLPGMIYRCRLDSDWTLLFVSDGARELTGHSPEELTARAGFPFAELVDPADRERIEREVREAVRAGRPFELQYGLIARDGTRKRVWERGRLVEGDLADGILEGLLLDVTAEQRAIEELRTSREMLERTEEIAGVGSWEMDLDSGRISWSQGMFPILGLDPEDGVPGFDAHARFIPPGDFLRLERAVAAARDRGEAYELALDVRRKDGTVRRCVARGRTAADAGGRVRWLHGSLTDVTEQERTAAERELLLTAISQTAEAIVITDAEARIRYVNPAFEEMSGYRREEALGRNPNIKKSGEHGPEFYEAMWKELTEGRRWAGRLVNRRKDGSRYTAELSISPVRDAEGRITGHVAVERDVSRELEYAQRLRQAEKMEAIGRLAGGIAHDFNNILAAILGYSDICLRAPELPASLEGDLREVHAAAERAAELTRQLLGFARRQSAVPRLVEPETVIERLLAMLRRLLGSGIELRWEPAAGPCRVRIDPSQLEQVVTNLLVNARDAVEPSGTVVLRSRLVEAGDSPPEGAGRCWSLEVEDDGCGIDARTRERLFEPFFTTKPEGRGTGLGLATAHGIVAQNRGELEVDSAPGRGSTFRVLLPAAGPSPARSEASGGLAPASASAEDLPAGGDETLLVVEDEAALRALVVRHLEGLGYRVFAAEDAEQALELARRLEDGVDLLVTDLIMPGLDGRQLHLRLREKQPGLPALYLSGHASTVLGEAELSEPGVDFLQKPHRHAELAAAVRAALDRAKKER